MPIAVPVPPAILCEQAASVEYRKDLRLFIVDAAGRRRAYTPEAFFETIAACVEVARQHRPWEQSAQIVQILDHQAASGKSSK